MTNKTRSIFTRPFRPSKRLQSAVRAKGHRRVSAAAPLPVLSQNLTEPAVFPLALTEALLPPDADGAVAAPFKGLAAGDVFRIDLGQKLVKVELAEGISRDRKSTRLNS